MALKVVIFGARLNSNLGGPSLYVGTEKAIGSFEKDAQISYFTTAQELTNDRNIQHLYGVEVLPLDENLLTIGGLFFRLFKFFPFPQFRQSHTALREADVIIDIWGIMFTDLLGKNTFINRFREGLRLLLGRIYRVPLIKGTAALGPFNMKWNRRLASFYLGRCVNHVMTRDEESYNAVNRIGVKKGVSLTGDTAFLLPSEDRPPVFIDESRENVLISVSQQAFRRAKNEESYLKTISGFIDHVIDEYSATVTLLPNAVVAEDNDLKIAEKVKNLVASEGCVVVDPTLLSAMQIKGVVSQSSVVVASRYHTVIAALSLQKPTISIGWHYKYRGVLGLFGMEEWDLPVENLTLDSLKNTFDQLWSQRNDLSKAIGLRLPQIKEDIYETYRGVLSSVLPR